MRANPYLTFDGTCEEAFGTYADILGGEIVAMMPYEGSPAETGVPAGSSSPQRSSTSLLCTNQGAFGVPPARWARISPACAARRIVLEETPMAEAASATVSHVLASNARLDLIPVGSAACDG